MNSKEDAQIIGVGDLRPGGRGILDPAEKLFAEGRGEQRAAPGASICFLFNSSAIVFILCHFFFSSAAVPPVVMRALWDGGTIVTCGWCPAAASLSFLRSWMAVKHAFLYAGIFLVQFLSSCFHIPVWYSRRRTGLLPQGPGSYSKADDIRLIHIQRRPYHVKSIRSR